MYLFLRVFMFKSTHTPGLDGGQALINSLDQAEKLRKGGGKKKSHIFLWFTNKELPI